MNSIDHQHHKLRMKRDYNDFQQFVAYAAYGPCVMTPSFPKQNYNNHHWLHTPYNKNGNSKDPNFHKFAILFLLLFMVYCAYVVLFKLS